MNRILKLYRNNVMRRFLASAPVPTEAELQKLLSSRFPKAHKIDVQDVSGGCGAMYEIYVNAAEFKGMSRVNQHKLVTSALSEQIKAMHGLRIHTESEKD